MSDAADSLETLCAAHGSVEEGGRFAAGSVFGDWRLTAFIGRGGNGEVYCAEHITLGTPAAVKVLVREEERAKARFAHEAKLLSELKSASFPRFFAYREANGRACLVMELLEPGELPTGDKAVARFMLHVCDGVAELHARGIIHRDIKPGNILWRKNVPVLADLGLAKSVSAPQKLRDESLTIVDGRRAGVGTPGYGAPEQMERGEASAASDIHALGVLADHCFGGRPPRAWARIIRRATSSIPAHRYPSVSAFAKAIRRRHRAAYLASSLSVVFSALIAGALFHRQAEEWWIRQKDRWSAPVLDASAFIDGAKANDAKWFLDDLPVEMPHSFVYILGGRQNWMPRRLCAVVQRDGKTYSAKRMDIIPEKWTGARKLSLALRENPPDGTVVNVYAQDGTPFEFAWCEPNDAANDRAGFWISTKRLSGKQLESVIKENPHLVPRAFHPFRHDSDSEFPATFGFLGVNTVPGASLEGLDFGLEVPDFRQWRLGMRLYADFYAEMPEWAGVPPRQKGDVLEGGGWMRMDGTGREKYIDNSGSNDSHQRTWACVRYLGVSRFCHETNTVAYSTAISLIHSEKASDVVHGEAMMKSFFRSDDHVLKMMAMKFCLKKGMSTLDDFGGTNADVRLRFVAVSCGDTNVIERLAVGDPDPDVRKEAYEGLANPSPMVSAMYISQIRHEDDPGDIGKPMSAVWSMTDRKALEYIIEHSPLKVFRVEASNRLNELAGK